MLQLELSLKYSTMIFIMSSLSSKSLQAKKGLRTICTFLINCAILCFSIFMKLAIIVLHCREDMIRYRHERNVFRAKFLAVKKLCNCRALERAQNGESCVNFCLSCILVNFLSFLLTDPNFILTD